MTDSMQPNRVPLPREAYISKIIEVAEYKQFRDMATLLHHDDCFRSQLRFVEKTVERLLSEQQPVKEKHLYCARCGAALPWDQCKPLVESHGEYCPKCQSTKELIDLLARCVPFLALHGDSIADEIRAVLVKHGVVTGEERK
jgi:hypothetical protein